MKKQTEPLAVTGSRFTDKAGAAAFIAVGPRTIERWMALSLIPYYRIGGVVRFDLYELRESLRRFNRQQTLDEVARVGSTAATPESQTAPTK